MQQSRARVEHPATDRAERSGTSPAEFGGSLIVLNFLQRAFLPIISGPCRTGEGDRGPPRALPFLVMLSALYLHHGPFSRQVIAQMARQIQDIDLGLWSAPLPAPAEDKEFSVA